MIHRRSWADFWNISVNANDIKQNIKHIPSRCILFDTQYAGKGNKKTKIFLNAKLC